MIKTYLTRVATKTWHTPTVDGYLLYHGSRKNAKVFAARINHENNIWQRRSATILALFTV